MIGEIGWDARRITIRLDQPTEDGNTEISLC